MPIKTRCIKITRGKWDDAKNGVAEADMVEQAGFRDGANINT